MKLREWLDVERTRLVEFELWYHRQHNTEPDKYPLDRDASSWDEDFQCFDIDTNYRPAGETSASEACSECGSPFEGAHAGDCRVATGMKPKPEKLGKCCYGGVKPKEHCASCAAWEAL